MSQTRKRYIGDGVYIEKQNHYYLIYTSDGISKTNTIMLGPEEATALIDFFTSKQSNQ